MQQGTIEGEENPINVIYSYSLWDYGQKYVTLDRHSYSTAIITMSLDVFNSLDEATQAIFLQRLTPTLPTLTSPTTSPSPQPPPLRARTPSPTR